MAYDRTNQARQWLHTASTKGLQCPCDECRASNGRLSLGYDPIPEMKLSNSKSSSLPSSFMPVSCPELAGPARVPISSPAVGVAKL